MNTTEDNGYVNPSLVLQPRRLRSFAEWMQRWNLTHDFDVQMGMLHSLTTNSLCWEQEKAVPFLLVLADGYLMGKASFYNSMDKDVSPKEDFADLRRQLARKAMAILLKNFFKFEKSYVRNHLHPWGWIVYKKAALARLIWFFRESISGVLRNFPSDNEGMREDEIQTLRKFILTFTGLAWREASLNLYSHVSDSGEIYSHLKSLRPQLIMILHGIGELRQLKDKELDRPSRKALKSIALDYMYPFPLGMSPVSWENRCAKDMNEAIQVGIEAAVLINSYAYRLKSEHGLRRFAHSKRSS